MNEALHCLMCVALSTLIRLLERDAYGILGELVAELLETCRQFLCSSIALSQLWLERTELFGESLALFITEPVS